MNSDGKQMNARILLTVLSICGAAGARGQEVSGAIALEEVIVTASKRSESLQEAALSVTALTGQSLQDLGANQFSDYAHMVPGLTAVDRGSGQKKYILRGINSENGPRLAPIVQQYLDEFPLTLNAGSQTDIRLYDVERVEVLRGPQGTLYGSGSMGGTIRTITRKPDLDNLGGYVEASLSNTHKGDENVLGNAVLNVPLVPGKLAVRAVAFDEEWSGFIDNLYTGRNNGNDNSAVGGRLGVRWRPLEQLDLDLTVLHQTVEADAQNEHMPGFIAPVSRFPPFVPWFPTNLRTPGDLQAVKAIDEHQKDENTIANLTAVYGFGSVELTSSTTYYRHHLISEQDTTELSGFGGYNLNDNEDSTFGQEVRLARAEGPFKWLVGAYYLRNESDPEDATQTAFFPDGSVFFESGTDARITQRALFGETSYDFAANWTATIGIRAADFDLSSANVLFAGMGPAGQPPGTVTGPFSVDESKVTTKYQLTWRPSQDVMIYGLAAQGFRPGGFNSAAFDPLLNPNGSIPPTFDSDSLWSYELGAKSSLFDQRATLNTSLFFVDWSDIQVTGYDQVTGAVSFTTNASKAEVYGVESEFSVALTQRLQLSLTAAYTNAELTEDQPAPPAGAPLRAGLPGFKGDRLPNVPRFSGGALANYEFPIAQSAWTGFVTGSASYTGESSTYLRRDDAFYRLQDSYTLAGLRFGVYVDAWRVTAFVDNLTDERAQLFINNLAGWDKINVNRPRTYGITARRTF